MWTSPVGWSVRAAKSSAAKPTTTESHIGTGPLWPSFSANGAADQGRSRRDNRLDRAWIDLVMKRNDIGNSYVFGCSTIRYFSLALERARCRRRWRAPRVFLAGRPPGVPSRRLRVANQGLVGRRLQLGVDHPRLCLAHVGARPAGRPGQCRPAACIKMGVRRSGTNADDRLFPCVARSGLGGDGTVEGRDAADVRPQSSIAHPLDDRSQVGHDRTRRRSRTAVPLAGRASTGPTMDTSVPPARIRPADRFRCRRRCHRAPDRLRRHSSGPRCRGRRTPSRQSRAPSDGRRRVQCR